AFVRMGALAVLAAWSIWRRAAGTQIEFVGDDDRCQYLARMGLPEMVGAPIERRFRRLPSAGRFLPLVTVAPVDGQVDVLRAVNGVCDLVTRQFDDARALVPALEWALNEVIDNIVTHAEISTAAVVCAQL